MATLDIRPHSRRVSAWVIAALGVVALAAFAEGLAHQTQQAGVAYFPPPQYAAPSAIAEATPAPALQVPPPHAPAHKASDDDVTAASVDASATDAASAQAAAPAPATTDSDAPPRIDPPPAQAPAEAGDEAPR